MLLRKPVNSTAERKEEQRTAEGERGRKRRERRIAFGVVRQIFHPGKLQPHSTSQLDWSDYEESKARSAGRRK